MTTDLQVLEAQTPAPPALFGTDDPTAIVARATAVAQPLARVIRDRKLYTEIQGREHVRVEGWTLLGSMLGVFPVTAWCRPVSDPAGWEARVEARTLGGALVGAAEAQCTRAEKRWASADDYALRSMAQTRASSKALRMPLGFVMALAGYEVTPAEEMPFGVDDPRGNAAAWMDGRIVKAAPVARARRGQLEEIGRLGLLLDYDRVDLGKIARERYEGRGAAELTEADAADLIGWLQGQIDEVNGAVGQVDLPIEALAQRPPH